MTFHIVIYCCVIRDFAVNVNPGRERCQEWKENSVKGNSRDRNVERRIDSFGIYRVRIPSAAVKNQLATLTKIDIPIRRS